MRIVIIILRRWLNGYGKSQHFILWCITYTYNSEPIENEFQRPIGNVSEPTIFLRSKKPLNSLLCLDTRRVILFEFSRTNELPVSSFSCVMCNVREKVFGFNVTQNFRVAQLYKMRRKKKITDLIRAIRPTL